MCQLNRGGGALPVYEIDDTLQGIALGIVPQAQALRRNAAFGQDAGGFHHYQTGAAAGKAAQMHQVPVIGHAINGRVLAHG